MFVVTWLIKWWLWLVRPKMVVLIIILIVEKTIGVERFLLLFLLDQPLHLLPHRPPEETTLWRTIEDIKMVTHMSSVLENAGKTGGRTYYKKLHNNIFINDFT